MQQILQEDTTSMALEKNELNWTAVKWIFLYSIWRHRNGLVFSDDKSKLVDKIFEWQRISFEWISRRDKKWSKNWDVWLAGPATSNGLEG